jgi:hypothetical protein
MKEWLQQNIWWIGFIFTILIAMFPQTFIKIGRALQSFIIKFWLQIGITFIIFLLLVVCNLLMTQGQAS